MIFGSLRQGSPASEGSFRRQKSLSDSKVDEGELGGNETKTKSFRRKRMELRRVRSLSIEKSDADPFYFGKSVSKKRLEVKEAIPFTGKAFSPKLPETDVGSSRESAAALTSHSHGSVSLIGRRREMEDAVAVELGFMKRSDGGSYDFFGVYDGHGGRRVALECGEMLHKVLATAAKEEEEAGEINWEKTVIAGFKKMDEEVNKSGAAVATMGSTAVVAVVGQTEVVVANCGDSRAVLSRGGVAVQLSDDHKPDRADELERIEDCGGKVINWNGERVLGVLATSRSIGDYYLKPYVIAVPEVRIVNITDEDEFLILASDGLWDVVSNHLACQVVRRCLLGHIRRRHRPNNENRAVDAAAVLAELAMGRGSHDNISVVVVAFKPRRH